MMMSVHYFFGIVCLHNILPTTSFRIGKREIDATANNNIQCDTKKEFRCPGDEAKCVKGARLLDGINDCLNGEDEDPHQIDACLIGILMCHSNATCSNLPADKYKCTCNEGFAGNGFTCSPSSESTTDIAPVPVLFRSGDKLLPDISPEQNATMLASTGCSVESELRCPESPVCIPVKAVMNGSAECPDGADEDPVRLDECALGVSMCDPLAICTNIPNGNYTCKCIVGFTGDGFTCNDATSAIQPDQRKFTSGLLVQPRGKSPNCPPETPYQCIKSNVCLPLPALLNGSSECLDGSDEDPVRLDECALGVSMCDPLAICTNIPNGNYTCKCIVGFTGDGFTCNDATSAIQSDKPEFTSGLLVQPRGKSPNCPPETPYQCIKSNVCLPLSALLNGSSECLDGSDEDPARVDECDLEVSMCHLLAICTNILNGNYTCKCIVGFTGDGFTCSPLMNDTASFIQSDQPGFTSDLLAQPRGKSPNCPPETPYQCIKSNVCLPLSALLNGSSECLDGSDEDPAFLDECDLGISMCHPFAMCRNIPTANYTCKCLDGFTGDGLVCLPDVKTLGEPSQPTDAPLCRLPDRHPRAMLEGCPTGSHFMCPNSSTCIPLSAIMNGTMECPDGADEAPSKLDECSLGTSLCHPFSMCVNIPNGNYTCQCFEGFTGDGFNCNPMPGIKWTVKLAG